MTTVAVRAPVPVERDLSEEIHSISGFQQALNHA